jgi:hypothetical protein
MKQILLVLLTGLLTACTTVKPVVFINSYPQDYTYMIEDGAKNVYYTNDFKQNTSTCIVFQGQDTVLHKLCGTYTITLLKY